MLSTHSLGQMTMWCSAMFSSSSVDNVVARNVSPPWVTRGFRVLVFGLCSMIWIRKRGAGEELCGDAFIFFVCFRVKQNTRPSVQDTRCSIMILSLSLGV